MNNRSNLITRERVNPPYMLLRAPKYIHQLGKPENSARFLRVLKATKIMTRIPDMDRYNWEEWFHRFHRGRCYREKCEKQYNPIQQVILKHFKTNKERCNTYCNRGFDRYSGHNRKFMRKFSRTQAAWNRYFVSIFSGHIQYWNDFLTKSSIRSVFVDFTFKKNFLIRKNLDIIVPRLVRQLTVLKGGLEVLEIKIESIDYKGQTFKFLNLLNNIFPLMPSKTKVRLILIVSAPDDIGIDRLFRILQLFQNIHQRIAHLEFSFRYLRGIVFESLVDFAALLKNLRIFRVSICEMKYFKNTVMEKLFDGLAANTNLRKLRVCIGGWSSKTQPATNTLDLSKYKSLLLRLEEFELSIPVLSFKNFNDNIKSELNNQSIQASKIALIGTIIDWKGFDGFIKMLRPTTSKFSALFLDVLNPQEKDVNCAIGILAKKLEFKQVYLTIRALSLINLLVYSRVLVKLFKKLEGPEYLRLHALGFYNLSREAIEMSREVLKNSSKTLRAFDILCGGDIYQFCLEQNRLLKWEENHWRSIQAEEIPFREEDEEEEGYE